MLTETRIAARSALVAAGVVIVSIAFLAGRATVGGGTAAGRARSVPGRRRRQRRLRAQRGRGRGGGGALPARARAGDGHAQRPAHGDGRAARRHEQRGARVRRARDVGDRARAADGAPLRRVAISTDPVSLLARRRAQITVLESWIYATAVAGGAVGDRARVAGLAGRGLAGQRRSMARRRRRMSRWPICARSSSSRESVMRRFASAAGRARVAATLDALDSGAGERRGDLDRPAGFSPAPAGRSSSVGKGVLCKGLSAAGTVAAGRRERSAAPRPAAPSTEGAGTAAGAAAGGAVGGVIKKGIGVVTKVICSGGGGARRARWRRRRWVRWRRRRRSIWPRTG